MRRPLMVWAAGVALGWLPLALSCSAEGETPTQVIVRFAADDLLRDRADMITIRVVDQNGDTVVERTDPVSSGADLARIPVVPKGGDPTRSFEVVGQLLDAQGETLGFERAVIGFEEQTLTEVLLVFDESCESVDDCGQGRRCVLGQCVGACVTPEEGGVEGESSALCSSCEQCVGTRCEPLEDGSPCGCSGDVCEAGACLVEKQTRAVALGSAHTCAHVDSDVYCWGANEHGQLGLPEVPLSPTPRVPLQLDTFIRRVEASGISTCVLSGSGTRYCFGENTLGQLGKGETDAGGPDIFESQNPSLRKIYAGGSHFCGLTDAQEAWCWGYNTHGQLGLGTDTHHENEPHRAAGFDGVQNLSLGGFQTCFLSAGTLNCVGFNDSGQLGVGDTQTRLEPVRPGCDSDEGRECFDDYTQVSSGSFHTCGLRENGALYCWGGNANGQVGVGVVGTDELLPARVGEDTYSVLSAGFQQTCALSQTGQAWCWGAGASGRLGDGTAEKRATPTPVHTPETDTAWVDLLTSKTGAHTCAIEGDGSLWCWGNNESGQLGADPAQLESSATPRRVCFP